MKTRTLQVFFLLLATTAGGCGTFDNLLETTPCSQGDSRPPRYVYGGLRFSASEGWRSIAHPHDLMDVPTGVVQLGLDVPACLVADTLTLPITVPAAMSRANRTAQEASINDSTARGNRRIAEQLERLYQSEEDQAEFSDQESNPDFPVRTGT